MERALVHAVQPRSCRRLFSITIASHGVCRRRRRSVAVDTLNTIVLMPALVVSVPPPPLLPEAVLIVVAVILVLLFLLVAIRFVSRQICSNLGFLGHAWRPVAMPRAIPSAHATNEGTSTSRRTRGRLFNTTLCPQPCVYGCDAALRHVCRAPAPGSRPPVPGAGRPGGRGVFISWGERKRLRPGPGPPLSSVSRQKVPFPYSCRQFDASETTSTAENGRQQTQHRQTRPHTKFCRCRCPNAAHTPPDPGGDLRRM